MPRLGLSFSDKIFHSIAFAGFAGASCLWISNEVWSRHFLRSLLCVLFVSIIVGAIDELHQYFVPSRVPSMHDLAADSVGAVFGTLVIGSWLSHRYRKGRTANQENKSTAKSKRTA